MPTNISSKWMCPAHCGRENTLRLCCSGVQCLFTGGKRTSVGQDDHPQLNSCEFDKTMTKIYPKINVDLNTSSKPLLWSVLNFLYSKTFTGFSGDDDNSSDAGLTKEERKEKYRWDWLVNFQQKSRMDSKVENHSRKQEEEREAVRQKLREKVF